MSFIEIMHTYFRSEKLEAFWFILPVGILIFFFGIVALKAERGGFAWGVARPCLIFGITYREMHSFLDQMSDMVNLYSTPYI